MPAVFGSSLHAAGMDRPALELAIRSLDGGGLVWKEVTPRLEDVFIHLLSKPANPPPGNLA